MARRVQRRRSPTHHTGAQQPFARWRRHEPRSPDKNRRSEAIIFFILPRVLGVGDKMTAME
jgi:hypothetical protein